MLLHLTQSSIQVSWGYIWKDISEFRILTSSLAFPTRPLLEAPECHLQNCPFFNPHMFCLPEQAVVTVRDGRLISRDVFTFLVAAGKHGKNAIPKAMKCKRSRRWHFRARCDNKHKNKVAVLIVSPYQFCIEMSRSIPLVFHGLLNPCLQSPSLSICRLRTRCMLQMLLNAYCSNNIRSWKKVCSSDSLKISFTLGACSECLFQVVSSQWPGPICPHRKCRN